MRSTRALERSLLRATHSAHNKPGVRMHTAAERLVQVQNIRVFELWLAQAANGTRAPCLAWTSATVAAVRAGEAPVVVVLVGLRRLAWLALGALHALAWWRVRRALGRSQQGYRVRIWVI